MVPEPAGPKPEVSKPAASGGLAVGTAVAYLPAEHQALTRDLAGNHAWVMGRKYVQTIYEGGTARQQEAVEELDEKRLEEYLAFLARHPNPAEERKNLVFLRPVRPWPALVTAVNEDGTVNLDIVVGNGFTLHEKRIRVDPTGKAPGSCHTRSGVQEG